MRVKVTETKVYKWEELTDVQKDKVMENYYDINVDYEWWDFVYEDAKNAGLEITAFDLDRYRNAEGHFILSAGEVAANIIRDHGENCETFKTAQNFLDSQNNYPMPDEAADNLSEWENRMIDLEEVFLQSLLEDYSIMLQREFEYLSSEEAIVETIKASEYEFDENGKIA